MLKHRWIEPGRESVEQAARLADAMDVPRPFAAVLLNRGVSTAEESHAFLAPDRSMLCDPFLLPDIEPALERLRRALRTGEPVFVCGDYDVDGITSIVLVSRCLRAAGIDVGFYIPNRVVDGYGLSRKGIDAAADFGSRLIVTVDSGVTGHEEIRDAASRGIDVIVTDHHEPQESLPPALAVVDPKRKDSRYPYKDLAGVGVAFKVMEALAQDSREIAYTVEENTDLVAVGTVADIVPLTSENRVLTVLGLDRLRRTANPGLRSLMEVADVEPAGARASHIGFALGPRLNAAGRLSEAAIGVELLTTEDPRRAAEIAQELDRKNRERRNLEARVLAEAERIIDEEVDLATRRSIVLWSEGWHPGVIGIVASRIAKQHNRPTILFSIANGLAKGSGRSIPGFDLHAALFRCRGHLETFGGHQHAAGVTLDPARLRGFRDCLEEAVAASLREEDLTPIVEIDAMVGFPDCDFALVKLLKRVRPFGAGNPEPVFGTRDVKVISAKVVGNGHLKMTVSQGQRTMDAIGFGMADTLEHLRGSGGMVRLAYVLEENTWRGETNLQLRLKDVQTEGY